MGLAPEPALESFAGGLARLQEHLQEHPPFRSPLVSRFAVQFLRELDR
ncbi:hypothetical protein [Streptomyces sp. H021]|nr:hypothetical protein [Streptomyces sp. H021]